MIPFYSKRNQVFPVVWQGRPAVEKHFHNCADYERELAVYRAISLPCPELLEVGDNRLVFSYCPYPTLLEELERQERCGFSASPWEALAAWLLQCEAELQLLPDEGNLRNFLWNEEQGIVLGLDFEGYAPISIEHCGSKIIAALMEYTPVDTPEKRAAAAVLAQRLQISADRIHQQRSLLQKNRQARSVGRYSAIILAGGKSSRMGQDKAGPQLDGRSLLEHQVQKVRALGIEDIMLSGADCPQLEGTRVIADQLPDRGPLGGLHACLQQAKHPRCLVLGVDVPLVPLSVLAQLCRAHTQGATVLRHSGGVEPLIGIYDAAAAEKILPLIESGSAPVRKLEQVLPWHTFSYMGPQAYLANCNTPQDFAQMELLAQQMDFR